MNTNGRQSRKTREVLKWAFFLTLFTFGCIVYLNPQENLWQKVNKVFQSIKNRFVLLKPLPVNLSLPNFTVAGMFQAKAVVDSGDEVGLGSYERNPTPKVVSSNPETEMISFEGCYAVPDERSYAT